MKGTGFKDRSTSELEQLEIDTRRELWKARFGNFTHQLDDTSKIKKLKRNVATIKTILSERRRSGSTPKVKE